MSRPAKPGVYLIAIIENIWDYFARRIHWNYIAHIFYRAEITG